MFKIGDVVEITEESDATGILDFKKGKGYEVERIQYNFNGDLKGHIERHQEILLRDEGGRTDWYHYTHFKLKEDTIVEKKECLFKEGQVVWDVAFGKGVVRSITNRNDPDRPITVDFNGDLLHYTRDGAYSKQRYRTLFFSEPKIEAATEPLFVPSLQVGTPIILSKYDVSGQMIPAWVTKETEEIVIVSTTDSVNRAFYKKEWNIYSVGEKINFK